jgi:hypothetical protein
MAIGYGLGLAFQGTPKDYVELVKSKQAAQQKAALTKATKDAARLQRTYDNFMRQVGTSNVLPINERGVQDALSEFDMVMEQQADADEKDFNAVTQAATQSVFKIKQLAANKKAWDSIRTNAVKYGFTPEEVAAIDVETDPVKLQTLLNEKGSGLINYDPTTNAISFTPVSDFKPLGESLGEFFTNYSGQIFNTPQKGKQTKIDKTNILYYGVDPNTKSIFVNENLNTPSANVNFETALRRSGQPIPQTQDEYLIKQTEFLGNAFEEGAKNRYKREKIGSGGGINITIGGKDEVTPGAAYIGQFDFNYGPESSTYKVNGYGSYAISDVSKTSFVASNMRNIKTLDPLTSRGGKFTSGENIIAPLFNKEVTLNIDGKNRTFKKGEMVESSFEEQQKKAGNVTYGLTSVGTFIPSGSNSEILVQIPSSSSLTQTYFALGKDEKPELRQEVQRLNDEIRRLNKPAGSAKPKEAPKEGGSAKGAFPSAAEWYKKNPSANRSYKLYLEAKRKAGF